MSLPQRLSCWFPLIVAGLIAPAVVGAADPFLKANGREVRDDRGKGDVVALRGVNLGSWLLMEPWMCPMDSSGLKDDYSARETLARRFGPATRDSLLAAYQDAYLTEGDLDNIAGLGMNVVRLPFWYLNLQEEDGTWRADAFGRLDWLVERAWRRGIYTILDLHGVPGGQSESENTGRLRKKAETGIEPTFWTEEANIRRAVEIWRRVAEHFRGNPAVAAYDLLNEPIKAPSRDALWAVYDRMYRAIRAVDPDHIITVEGCWAGQADGQSIHWGWDVLPPPTRAKWRNVAYQMHHYEWDWNNLARQTATADAQVRDAREHKDWNVPAWLGEFNPMAQAKAWDHAVAGYSRAGIGWMVWNYKATHGTGDDSWGIYNPRDPMPPRPDLQHDAAEVIRAKWSGWTTAAAYAPNPLLRHALAMPVPGDDAYATPRGRPLTVPAPGVLGNDAAGEPGAPLTAQAPTRPGKGKLDLRADGSFTFTPDPATTGPVTFRYRAFDGRLDSARVGTVTVTVTP